LDIVTKIVKAQNPEARIIYTDYGKVALNDIMGTGLFDFAKAETMAGWYKELMKKASGNSWRPAFSRKRK